MDFDVSASKEANRLGVHRTTLVKAIKDGKCAGECRNGQWYTSKEAAEEWAKQNYRHYSIKESKRSGKSWSHDEIDSLRSMFSGGVPIHIIANHIGKTQGGIRIKAYKLNINVDAKNLICPYCGGDTGYYSIVKGVVIRKCKKCGKTYAITQKKCTICGVPLPRGRYKNKTCEECSKKTTRLESVPFSEKSFGDINLNLQIEKIKQDIITSKSKIDWLSVAEYLGIKTDAEVSAILKCSPWAVFRYRKKLGITSSNGDQRKPHKFHRSHYNFDSVKDILGVENDVSVAKILGCTPEAVGLHRRKRGIAASKKRDRSNSRTSRYDWSKVDRLLGVKTDPEIAKMLGSTPVTVAKRREKLGIPPAPLLKKIPKNRYDWSKFDHLFATKSDLSISNIVGCDITTVWSRRKKLGIPAPPK